MASPSYVINSPSWHWLKCFSLGPNRVHFHRNDQKSYDAIDVMTVGPTVPSQSIAIFTQNHSEFNWRLRSCTLGYSYGSLFSPSRRWAPQVAWYGGEVILLDNFEVLEFSFKLFKDVCCLIFWSNVWMGWETMLGSKCIPFSSHALVLLKRTKFSRTNR